MSLFPSVLFLLLLSIVTTYALDLEQCEDGGSCHTLRETVEALVESVDCRSFYATGKCPESCFRELKRIFQFKKDLWNACSLVCWTEAYRELIEGWVALCESYRSRESGKDKVFDWLENTKATGRESLTSLGTKLAWRWWLLSCFYLVAGLAFLALTLRIYKVWKQKKKQASLLLKKNLDIAEPPESLFSRRGARRHLFKLLLPEKWNKLQ
jgi:hypothetical protein